MKETKIIIPNVDRDERIGSAFNHLFQIIAQTENVNGDALWDFSQVSFLHPFFLGPLAIYRHKVGATIRYYIPNRSAIDGYFKILHFDKLYSISDIKDNDALIDRYFSKSYTPIFKFRNGRGYDNESIVVQTILEKIVYNHIKNSPQIGNVLSYLLSELICNIGEHSLSPYGYLFAQYLPKDRSLNICIADDGISIYGSYMSSVKYADQIDSEATAIKFATDGFSTKNLPYAENRGYGISTSKAVLVDGLKGSFFILSGRAFHRHDTEASRFVNLPPSFNWDGTIILLRIPLHVPENFNLYNFIS